MRVRYLHVDVFLDVSIRWIYRKCKGCTRVGTVTLVPGYGSPLMLDKSKAGEYTLMLLDYQGLEPVDFSFGKGWKAESVLGTQFEIDLAEGEFSAYCVEGKVPVSLSGFEVKLG
ncbi:hypothetical protein AQUCO_02000315v1 [Aquilegia coerulea]|uniref:Uncharacterized protein n=1 Tax=Aquilegia coerulea TaxID=218851 RepID=A0A2G5DH01_AQUCA|nr:hypothetical protein AQUCO_02000315v1 [Aquilegia coerulea]